MSFRFAKAASLLLAVFLSDAANAQGGMPTPGVGVVQPVARRITLWDEYTGRFEAVSNVELRARVSGFVEAVHFRDGQLVEKGALLYSIEKRQFELTRDAARADVARAEAQVALAQTDLERADALARNQTITARDVDQRRANLAVAKASLEAASAALANANLNLEWCEVRAPVSGRVSDRRIDPGNLVTGGQASGTLLTTIVTVNPVHFAFEASEADYLRYTRLLQSGQRASGRDTANPVMVRLADETEWKREGRMNFVDNVVNPKSGTIRGRAVFDNPDGTLTPGTFGRMRLFGGEIDALLVPDAAIVSDQARKVALTVGPDNKVIPKVIELGQVVDGLRVVRSGLATGDRVIVEGLANPMVRPGAVVAPRPAAAAPTAR